MSAASKTTPSVVSPGETAFLIELSVALHKHAMYPTGHQSLEPAAARVAERAARLLESRPTLAFGVARHQLIIEGIATDPNHPVLRRLAETLHLHHLGAVSILRGVESHEISGALLALAEEVSNGSALGLTPGGRLPEWPHVRLHPLTLEWTRVGRGGFTDTASRRRGAGAAPGATVDRPGPCRDGAGLGGSVRHGPARSDVGREGDRSPHG